jgi:hypothetical protein
MVREQTVRKKNCFICFQTHTFSYFFNDYAKYAYDYVFHILAFVDVLEFVMQNS